jgi:hypothetical protein
MEQLGVAGGLQRRVLRREAGRAPRVGLAHDDDEADALGLQPGPKHGRGHGALTGLHGARDGRGGGVPVAIEANRPEVQPVPEGGVHPLIAEDGKAGPGRLAIQDGRRGTEERFAVERGPPGGDLRAVRPGEGGRPGQGRRDHADRPEALPGRGGIDEAGQVQHRHAAQEGRARQREDGPPSF